MSTASIDTRVELARAGDELSAACNDARAAMLQVHASLRWWNGDDDGDPPAALNPGQLEVVAARVEHARRRWDAALSLAQQHGVVPWGT